MYADEIKKAIEEKKAIIGNDEVGKAVRKESVKKVFITSNYPEKESLKEACEAAEIEYEEIKEDNDELGTLCKMPFSISIIGITKE